MLTIEDLIDQKLEFAEKKRAGLISTSRKHTSPGTVPVGATCGNCANLSYSGIMEVKMEWGTCDEYKLAGEGRFVNQPHFKACPFWQRRPAARVQAEMLYAGKMGAALRQINESLKGGARSIDRIKVERPAILNKKSSESLHDELLGLLGGGQSTTDDADTDND